MAERSKPRVAWHQLKFTEFVSTIGVTLYPGQRALTLVAYDGLEPCELTGELRSLAREIFGPVERIPPEARHVFGAVCGGRAGKSYVLGALRLVHLALTVPLDVLAPGEQASGIVVAPDQGLAGQVVRYMGGALWSHAELRECITERHMREAIEEGRTLEGIRIRRPHDGRIVNLEQRAASRGGTSGRGRTLIGAVLDESCFFRDSSSGVVNDKDIFDAAKPRVLPGGQTILISTPWVESGVLFDLFALNHPNPSQACSRETPGTPTNALAAHAPSLLLRPDPVLAQQEAAELDSVNRSREFGARFLTGGASAFFDSLACSRVVEVQPVNGQTIRALGVDLAHRRNSAAYVAVERGPNGYRVLEAVELKPVGGPLKHSDVLATMTETAKRWAIVEVVGDQHYAESAREACANAGLVFIDGPAGAEGKAEAYTATKRPLHEGEVDLGGNDTLRSQLRETQSRPLSGGGVSITTPEKRTVEGGVVMQPHGDVGSAFVLAMWHLARTPLPVPPPEPVPEADAWERRVFERASRSDDERGPRWRRRY